MTFGLQPIARAVKLGLAVFFCVPLPAHAAPVDAYLPKSGVMETRVMVAVASPEVEKIAQKMQAAAAKDPQWWLAYVKQHENDRGALPYDPKLGVTPEEYGRFVGLGLKRFHLQEIGRVTITIKPGADGTKILDVPPKDKGVSGFAIAVDGLSARTPEGMLPAAGEVHVTDPDGPAGAWDGVSFAIAGDPQHDVPHVEVAFGKRAKEGDGIIYYHVDPSSKGPAREFVILYPLK